MKTPIRPHLPSPWRPVYPYLIPRTRVRGSRKMGCILSKRMAGVRTESSKRFFRLEQSGSGGKKRRNTNKPFLDSQYFA